MVLLYNLYLLFFPYGLLYISSWLPVTSIERIHLPQRGCRGRTSVMGCSRAGACIRELRVDCMRVLFAFLCLSFAATLLTQCEGRVSKQSLKFSHPSEHVYSQRGSTNTNTNKIQNTRHLEMDASGSALVNTQPYVSSPFSLPPFDSLGPMPMPENTPPFCEYPPSTPQTPSTSIPTPVTYTSTPPPPSSIISTPILPIGNPPPSTSVDVPSPPESSPIPNPPEYGPSPPSFAPGTPEYVPTPDPPSTIPGTPQYFPTPNPPSTIPGTAENAPPPPNPSSTIPGTPEYVPSPTNPPSTVPGTPEYVPSPPDYSVPSPQGDIPGTPGYGSNPPIYIPSPSGFTPSPTVFQPPVVYPPPSVPPPPYRKPRNGLWCVVKPSVPDPIIQEAMNYACGSGADCGSIQQDGSCYKPDTLFAHASYAFNSYWQRTKAAGGTCDFGGTGMLVTVDPSFDGCHFLYY